MIDVNSLGFQIITSLPDPLTLFFRPGKLIIQLSIRPFRKTVSDSPALFSIRATSRFRNTFLPICPSVACGQ